MVSKEIEKLLETLRGWSLGQLNHVDDSVLKELSDVIAKAINSHDYQTLKRIEREVASLNGRTRGIRIFYTGVFAGFGLILDAACKRFEIEAVKNEVAEIENGKTAMMQIKKLADAGKPFYRTTLKQRLMSDGLSIRECDRVTPKLYGIGCISYEKDDYTERYPDDMRIELTPKGLLFFEE